MAKNSGQVTISMNAVKELRSKTNAGIMDAKRALEESHGDMAKAEAWLREKGLQRFEKKADRETKAGVIASYVHTGGQIAVLVELNCETDFVARTDTFQDLGRQLAMQIASMAPTSVEELMSQAHIRNPKETMQDLLKSVAATLGENVTVARFTRFAVGDSQLEGEKANEQ